MKQSSLENITSALQLSGVQNRNFFIIEKLHSEWWPLHPPLLFWGSGVWQWGELGPGEPLLRFQSFLYFTWISNCLYPGHYWAKLHIGSELWLVWHYLTISPHMFIQWQRLFPQVSSPCVISGPIIRSMGEERTDVVICDPLASGLTLMFIWHIRYPPTWKTAFLV